MRKSNSINEYIKELIEGEEGFDLMDFSPDRSDKIFEKFKEIFYAERCYWKPNYINEEKREFRVEFRRPNNQEKTVVLQFSFQTQSRGPQVLLLELKDVVNRGIPDGTESINIFDLWLNYEFLAVKFNMLVRHGVRIANNMN